VAISIRSVWGFQFLHILVSTCHHLFLIRAILGGMKWYLDVSLVFSPWWLKTLFSCAYWPLKFSLEKYLFLSFALFNAIGSFFFFLLLCPIFSYLVYFLLYFLNRIVEAQIFNWRKSALSTFSFVTNFLVSCLGRFCPGDFFPVFSCTFIILNFPSRLMTHLSHFLYVDTLSSLGHLLKILCFRHWIILAF
jgi:hypothetical protein